MEIVQESCEFTLQQINDDLRRQLPQKPRVCNNTVANILNCRLITLKLSRDIPQQRNTPEIKTARREVAEWMLRNGERELIFIDESGFRLWMKRSYGRAPRGQPAIRVVNARNSGHMSLIFAVSQTHGLLRHEFIEGGVKSARFN